MAANVLWVCVLLLLYSYLLYPLLVWGLARRFGIPVRRAPVLSRVTIIVTAYNEQKCIRAKLDNLAGLSYPPELLEILVASDGSTDSTETIAANYEARSVRVLRLDGRRGKTACQNAAAAAATGDILVFTDATTRLESRALMALLESFADPTVGCVGGRLEYVADVEHATACGTYWDYELRLRAAESDFGSLIGVSGCLYAVRKSVYRKIDPEVISDFVIAMKMEEQGLRTVLAPDAVCFETTLTSGRQELSMRVRVVVRTLNAIVHQRQFLNPFKYGRFAWQLWSHKVLRYASPLLWLTALASNIALASETPYLLLLAAQLTLIAAGTTGCILQQRGRGLGMLQRPYYLLLTNAASLIATLRYLRGERMVVWTPLR